MINVQSHNLIAASHPHVITFDVSWGSHTHDMQTESCALNLVNILVVFHSQTVNFPSASPDTTKLHVQWYTQQQVNSMDHLPLHHLGAEKVSIK